MASVPVPRDPAPRTTRAEVARADLLEDLEALAALARSSCLALDRVGEELALAGRHIPPRALTLVEGELRTLRHRHERWAGQLDELASEAAALPPATGCLARVAEHRHEFAALLRSQRGRLAGVITATDWQAPSYLSAGGSLAGRFTGAVAPHAGDYKRDGHHDALAYERRYLRELLASAPGIVHALMTACGMAAITTTLAWLRAQGGLRGRVVVGRGVYHETKELVAEELGGAPVEVDESDTPGLVGALGEEGPIAVFLDTIGNACGMPAPDLGGVLAALGEQGRDAWVVIDNTGGSPLANPLAGSRRDGGRLRVVVIESLTKYAQLGLDRTTAGILVASGEGCELLAGHRERLGTNVLDASVHMLPWPDRGALATRLRRLERNATLLAERLEPALAGGRTRVSHPGLAGHPAYDRALPFRGGFLTIDLDPALGPDTGERFVLRAVCEAARAGARLAAGASFGLDVTRAYAPRLAPGELPFVRVAAGIEDRLEIERVASALDAASRELSGPERSPRPARAASIAH